MIAVPLQSSDRPGPALAAGLVKEVGAFEVKVDEGRLIALNNVPVGGTELPVVLTSSGQFAVDRPAKRHGRGSSAGAKHGNALVQAKGGTCLLKAVGGTPACHANILGGRHKEGQYNVAGVRCGGFFKRVGRRNSDVHVPCKPGGLSGSCRQPGPPGPKKDDARKDCGHGKSRHHRRRGPPPVKSAAGRGLRRIPPAEPGPARPRRPVPGRDRSLSSGPMPPQVYLDTISPRRPRWCACVPRTTGVPNCTSSTNSGSGRVAPGLPGSCHTERRVGTTRAAKGF